LPKHAASHQTGARAVWSGIAALVMTVLAALTLPSFLNPKQHLLMHGALS
jgi:hypothetical protein